MGDGNEELNEALEALAKGHNMLIAPVAEAGINLRCGGVNK
jgi:hypothetical protein